MNPVQTADRRIWLGISLTAFVALLCVPLSQSVFGLHYDYTLQTVALGGALLGAVSGAVGCFAVLRQQSLIGDALSHAALPGVALAFLFAGRELGVLLIGAGITGWVGVMFVRAITATTRIKQDTALGIVLVVWFAFGIALLTYIQGQPNASQAGLETFIFGQAAGMRQSDLVLIGGVGLALIAVILVFWQSFKLITFDVGFARANGAPVRVLDAMLSTLIVVAIVLGLRLAGVILMVGLLIAPASAARQWTRTLGQMVTLSAILGAIAGAVGAIISGVDVNVPTGPVMIVVAVLIVFFSLSFAPERGLVWTAIKNRRDRQRFLLAMQGQSSGGKSTGKDG